MPRPLEDIQDDILDRIHAGEAIDREAILAEHPEHAEALTAFFGVIQVVEGDAEDLGPALARLGEFRIVREIGRGGMGRVYEAEQTSLKRRVALKVLPPTLRLDAGLVSRFHREAESAGRLRHPGIVPVFSVGEAAGTPFFAMELVEGVSLRHVIAKRRAGDDAGLPTGGEGWRHWAVETVAKVADALAYAHGQGILHRDVKPANILLDESGVPRLTDFGLAQDLRAPELTQTGEVFGSPQYMSPEQALRRDAPIDERTDVYSLAVTLYELLTLRLPYEGTSSPEVLTALLAGKVVPPRKVKPSIPRPLERVLLGALHRDPLHRYASASAFAHDLRATSDGAAPEHVPAMSVAKRLRIPAAAAALVGLVVLAYALWPGSPSRGKDVEKAQSPDTIALEVAPAVSGDPAEHEASDTVEKVLAEYLGLGPAVTPDDHDVCIRRLRALDTQAARDALRRVYEDYVQSVGCDDPEARAFLGYQEFAHEVPEGIAFRRYPYIEVVEAAAEKRWFGPDEEDAFQEAETAWEHTVQHLGKLLADARFRTQDRVRAQIAQDKFLEKYDVTALWAGPYLVCHMGSASSPFFRAGMDRMDQVTPVLEAVSAEFTSRFAEAFGLKPLMNAYGGRPDLPLGLRSFEDGVPLVVLLFDTRDDWLEYVRTLQAAPVPPTTRAFFSPSTTNLYVFVEGPRAFDFAGLAHEAVHQLLYWYRRQRMRWREPTPSQDWFEDGLAEYFAGLHKPDDGNFTVTGLNPVRLQSMMSMHKLLRQRGKEYPIFPLRELVSFPTLPQAQQWATEKYGFMPSMGVSLFYDQAYALTHFLNHAEDGKYREGYTKFCTYALDHAYGARGWPTAFARAFGLESESDHDAFEAAFHAWLQEHILK